MRVVEPRHHVDLAHEQLAVCGAREERERARARARREPRVRRMSARYREERAAAAAAAAARARARRARTFFVARVGQNLDGDRGPLPHRHAHAAHRATGDLLLDLEALGRDRPLAAVVAAFEPADRAVLLRLVDPSAVAHRGELARVERRELAAQVDLRLHVLGSVRALEVGRRRFKLATARGDDALERLKRRELVEPCSGDVVDHRGDERVERRRAARVRVDALHGAVMARFSAEWTVCCEGCGCSPSWACTL